LQFLGVGVEGVDDSCFASRGDSSRELDIELNVKNASTSIGGHSFVEDLLAGAGRDHLIQGTGQVASI